MTYRQRPSSATPRKSRPTRSRMKRAPKTRDLIAVEAIVEDDLCLYGKVVGTGYP